MNEADVQKLKEKILKCDQIIHVQQLGLQWLPPQEQEENPLLETDVTKNSKDIQEMSQNDFALEVNDEQLEIYVDILLQETSFLFDDKVAFLFRSRSRSRRAARPKNSCSRSTPSRSVCRSTASTSSTSSSTTSTSASSSSSSRNRTSSTRTSSRTPF